jgi:hypothetical protein
LSQWEIIVYPAEELGKSVTAEQILDKRDLLPLLAVQIVHNPVAYRAFRTYPPGIPFNLLVIVFKVVSLM